MKLLITGCARSGTMYLADLLRAAGTTATHEATYRMGPGQPIHTEECGEVDVSADAGLMIDELAPHVEAIGHVVRHPQEVVASIVGRDLWGTAWKLRHEREYLRIKGYSDPRDKALAYWIEHNRRIQQLERDPYYVRFALNDRDGLRRALRLARLPDVLGLAVMTVPRTSNAGTPLVYDWSEHDDRLRSEAAAMVVEYGLAEAVAA